MGDRVAENLLLVVGDYYIVLKDNFFLNLLLFIQSFI